MFSEEILEKICSRRELQRLDLQTQASVIHAIEEILEGEKDDREGAGIVKLRGMTNQCRARFLVDFSGNIQIPTGGAVGEISLALAVDGEPLQATKMIVTPAAVENFFNVSAQSYIDVPKGCCSTVAVQNTSTQAIEVQNSNLTVVRVA